MYLDKVEPLAVQVARETLEMQRELVCLRDENNELRKYRKLYMDLLNADIEHGQHMMGNLLKLALTPGVMAACDAANADAPKRMLGITPRRI